MLLFARCLLCFLFILYSLEVKADVFADEKEGEDINFSFNLIDEVNEQKDESFSEDVDDELDEEDELDVDDEVAQDNEEKSIGLDDIGLGYDNTQNTISYIKTSELFSKVKYGQKYNIKSFETWLTQGNYIDECVENGKTMLVELAKNSKDLESISFLIDNGADMITRCNPKYNVLFVAAEHNMFEKVVDLLINKGADVLYNDFEGNNVVNIAAMYNRNHEVMQTLLEYGLQINYKNNMGHTPLMLASNLNNLLNVKTLIRNGASINEVDNNGRTALMAAAIEGKDDIMHLLIRYGANIKIVDKFGMNVVDFYNKNKYLDEETYKKVWVNEFDTGSQRLEKKYEYIKKQHNYYNDLLKEGIAECKYALTRDNAINKVILALDNYADIEGKVDYTPLCDAAENGSYEVFSELVKRGANIKAKCKPLFLTIPENTAMDNLDEESKYKVLQSIKKIELLKDDVKKTKDLLWQAIAKNAHKDYVLKIIEYGFRDKKGKSSFRKAVDNNYPVEVLQKMIEKGFDVRKEEGLLKQLLETKDYRADVIDVLLKNGAQWQDEIYKTPLCYYLEKDCPKLRPSLFNSEEIYEVEKIYYDRNLEILDVLAKNDKNLDKPLCGMLSPLTFLVTKNYPSEMVKILLNNDASPYEKDLHGKSMVDYLSASEFYDDTMVEKTRENVLEDW